MNEPPPDGRTCFHVVGCGRLGALLAADAHRRGWPTVVIDLDPRSFDRLGDDFGGQRVVGDATQMHTLRRAGIGTARWLLACCRDDNVNLLVAQVASRILGVPEVVARVHDPSRRGIYETLAIDTFSPTELARAAVLDRVGER